MKARIALVALALLAAGCATSQSHTVFAAASSPTATFSPLERCQATVMLLLARTIQATQVGYSGGISQSQVMDEYGSDSAVFQTFEQANAQVLIYVAEYGPDGALKSAAGLVRSDCQQFGA
ncbi:MAG TPA: hypothetical protein VNF75_01005 [Candidatus Dormibacteraeota bacterium]|nr:hypothetical protein [Candidatus Dormibacteraeota bacterium]